MIYQVVTLQRLIKSTSKSIFNNNSVTSDASCIGILSCVKGIGSSFTNRIWAYFVFLLGAHTPTIDVGIRNFSIFIIELSISICPEMRTIKCTIDRLAIL